MPCAQWLNETFMQLPIGTGDSAGAHSVYDSQWGYDGGIATQMFQSV